MSWSPFSLCSFIPVTVGLVVLTVELAEPEPPVAVIVAVAAAAAALELGLNDFEPRRPTWGVT